MKIRILPSAMPFLSRPMNALSGVLLGALAACSSGDKKTTGQKPMTDSMAGRVMNTDINKRSSFESSLVRRNSGMGKHLQQRGFKAKDYAGNTSYKVPKTLKQQSFSGADDRSRMGRQEFSGSHQQNRFADDNFSTAAAREAGTSARQQEQVFRESNDGFKTGQVRDAARSQADNKRPLIVKPKGETHDATAYSEDEIRRLVNRR